MKKLLCAAMLAAISGRALATIHTIHVGDMYFTPASVPSVHPGDTLMWLWDNGTHTTTSTTLPSGATAWTSNLTSTTPTYRYVAPSIPGAYNYRCDVHPTMMTGSFTVVTSGTAIGQAGTAATFNCYPSPADAMLSITCPSGLPSQVTIASLGGSVVLQQTIHNGSISIDTRNFAGGAYIVRLQQAGFTQSRLVTITH